MTIEHFAPGESYASVRARQQAVFQALVEAKMAGRPGREALLWGEHHPVYTLGFHADERNLLCIGDVEAVRIERGGDVTFHGPGQLVVYPLIDLERRRWGVKDYVGALEEAVIRTCADFGVTASRRAGAPGVWLADPERKICALGIKCSRYATMHGLALNVTTDLDYFHRINPCGFRDRGVTSLARETGRPGLGVDTDVWPRLLGHLRRLGVVADDNDNDRSPLPGDGKDS